MYGTSFVFSTMMGARKRNFPRYFVFCRMDGTDRVPGHNERTKKGPKTRRASPLCVHFHNRPTATIGYKLRRIVHLRQGKLEERNAGYWRIATALNQEIPPAWVTHAARKRAKRAKAARREESSAQGKQPPLSPLVPWLPAVGRPLPPRGPFGDRVDRVFFFGDLNYRVDLSREDLELGVSVCRREQAPEEGDGAGQGKERERARRRGERRSRPGE